MNNFSYENQGTNTYLVYTVGEEDSIDSMSLGMITNNAIPGLAKTTFVQMDSKKFIKYNISSKVSVNQFFSGPVNKVRLLGVFNGVVDAMLSAEEYMIDMNTVLLNNEYIFADVSTCETILICVPVISDDLSLPDLGLFFKNIMFSTQFDQTENCDYVAKIINYLNSAPVFSLTDFKEILDSISREKTSQHQANSGNNSSAQKATVQPHVKSSTQSAVQQPIQQPVQQPIQQPVQQPIQQPVQQPIQKMVTPSPKVNTPPMKGNKKTHEVQSDSSEKGMSFLYLMQHYNKENAAAYKAQKDAKKTGGAAVATPVAPKEKNSKKEKPAKTNQGGFASSFAIPGQQTNINQQYAQGNAQVQQGGAAGQVTIPPVQMNNPTPQPTPQSVYQPTPQPTPQPSYQPPVQPQGRGGNFGETTVLGGGNIGETTVLNAGMMQQTKTVNPYLVRSKNNEKIPVNKPVFRVGKERSYVDYFIGDNTAISRSHANIITENGEYFVEDTNSTNHTFVNGNMIPSSSKVKINDGDRIRFANEDFEFKLF